MFWTSPFSQHDLTLLSRDQNCRGKVNGSRDGFQCAAALQRISSSGYLAFSSALALLFLLEKSMFLSDAIPPEKRKKCVSLPTIVLTKQPPFDCPPIFLFLAEHRMSNETRTKESPARHSTPGPSTLMALRGLPRTDLRRIIQQ